MVIVEQEVDRYLTLLRNKIRERGFTQLEVQEALGWGRSYISQLLTKQKSLRIGQVLAILHVIGIEQNAFFAELYGGPFRSAASQLHPRATAELPRQQLDGMTALLRGLTELLREKGLIVESELREAVERARNSSE